MSNTEILPTVLSAEESAQAFLQTIFQKSLEQGCGEIEIRTFSKPYATQVFYNSIEKATDKALELSERGIDAYFGVNLRVGKGGKKENVDFVSAFHVDLDYGSDGHKKKSKHETYDQALMAIRSFKLPPSIVVHTGGGLHCYWVLKEPLKVSSIGLKFIEDINKKLSAELGGDSGYDISHVLRVPGTLNYKLEGNPREVKTFSDSGLTYTLTDFISNPAKDAKKESAGKVDIASLPVSDKIKSLILNGNDGTYPSRSEADMAVIVSLVNKGIGDSIIKVIFDQYAIGEKYREHNDPVKYLSYSIKKAHEFSGLSEEERLDPLFLSDSIIKSNNKYRLEITRFQEYMTKKYLLKIHESTFFRYNGKCYEPCTYEAINNLCQKELSVHRSLFSQGHLNGFIHYSVGDILLDGTIARRDQVAYLTLNNGLYSLVEDKMLPHDQNIFTTNLLPYDHDSNAQCPRFLQYLDEVFLSDREKIIFVQEAFGYALHKSIPMPALFFLVGNGSNGKSTFLDVLRALYGQHNTSSINLTSLTNEYYIIDLFGKMINIASETPRKRLLNSDVIKAVVAGVNRHAKLTHFRG